MASIHSVRAHHLHLSARLTHVLRLLAMTAALGAVAAIVLLRLGWLAPRLKAVMTGISQGDVFLGVVVLTAVAIVVAVRAAADYRAHTRSTTSADA